MTHVDDLIRHLKTCAECITAKATRTASRCQRRKELVLLTLEERS